MKKAHIFELVKLTEVRIGEGFGLVEFCKAWVVDGLDARISNDDVASKAFDDSEQQVVAFVVSTSAIKIKSKWPLSSLTSSAYPKSTPFSSALARVTVKASESLSRQPPKPGKFCRNGTDAAATPASAMRLCAAKSG